MRTNQKTLIINILDDGNFHCSSEFYREYIADPRSRISSLKKDGHQLEWRWCKSHSYHDGNQKEWRLIKFSLIQETLTK